MKPTVPRNLTLLFFALGLIVLVKFCFLRTGGETLAAEFRTCGIADDLPQQLRSSSNKLIVVVVGDGVKDKTPAKARPYSSNYAQGWDLYEGVANAAKKPPFDAIATQVEIVYVDDGGDSRCAELISEEIVRSQRVIAVIGHATTGTTKVALKNYKKANIPLIIPVATNPELTLDCKNCFRLPSNDDVQARAIADYAVNQLMGQNVYLVWDESPSAKDYSEFLQAAIVELIGSKIKFKQPITFRPMNYDYLLKSISYNNTDVLIFCGYGSMAREFLNGLRFEYDGKEPPLKKPRIILSDGARISDINEVSRTFGFEAYLSFPGEKLSDRQQPPSETPRAQEKTKIEESYEVFGHDALTLFALAFKHVKGNLTRQSLRDALAAEAPSSDLFYRYKFARGENVNPRYFIYSVGSDTIVKSYDDMSTFFTDKPVAEVIGVYDDITSTDTAPLDTLARHLTSDGSSKGLIIVSDDRNPAVAEQHAKRFLERLVKSNIEPSRIDLLFGTASKEQAQLYWIPAGANSPATPDKHKQVNGTNLMPSSQQ
ncbi:MAG TPA: ABC transporter substrate-binding protein [Pyrinomonadaceae bacterium]|nr:ABC transporter substrate-binding protein [Pyrinomonadaceae bacterium]